MGTANIHQIEEGWDVYGSDGDKIGDVAEVGADYFIVSKGFFFQTDIYIPTTAVVRVEHDRVELNVTKDEVERQGWDEPPVRAAGTETVGLESTDDSARIERHEEELRARTVEREAGEVRIDRDVVEEEESIEVPVTSERVEVTSRDVDRPGAAHDAFRGGESISVPVHEEQVEVTKEPRVVEEIEISKSRQTGTQRVSDTVRKERIDIDEEAPRSDR